ncbi:hypothetical protein DFJ66_5922 [Saccharothrix variisporea]|uniref:Uncharacterized protein n=1 Tax=Saccharothrix variisporea TaxID=543527 RepID=A0A495XHN9_9PSEU|nr:hypothetical protein DFJ66_5922 [Saccharothrix variisporea]
MTEPCRLSARSALTFRAAGAPRSTAKCVSPCCQAHRKGLGFFPRPAWAQPNRAWSVCATSFTGCTNGPSVVASGRPDGERNRRPSSPGACRAASAAFHLGSAPARPLESAERVPFEKLEKLEKLEKMKSASPAGRPPRMTQLQRRGLLAFVIPVWPGGANHTFGRVPLKFFARPSQKISAAPDQKCGSPSGRPYGDDKSKKPKLGCVALGGLPLAGFAEGHAVGGGGGVGGWRPVWGRPPARGHVRWRWRGGGLGVLGTGLGIGRRSR